MSATEDSILKTQQFIDDAQEVIDRTNDLMAALNRLTGKTAGGKGLDPKQLAQHARLEEDLEALVQRYFPSSAALSGKPGEETSASSSQNQSTARPGRFRSRI
jgi:hypothetical protein